MRRYAASVLLAYGTRTGSAGELSVPAPRRKQATVRSCAARCFLRGQ